MQIKKLQVDQKFLEEETICGYTVTNKMKKVWAIELDMLKKVQEICEKHNIEYYADSGTLIGAIRHKGFIPWDDDIDIVMKRNDYNKFLEVAPKELEFPYFLQTAYTDLGYCRAHAQIRNSVTTAYNPHDKNACFNMGIFLDIFPLDELPDNNVKLKIQLFRMKILWKIMESAINYTKDKNNSIKYNVFCFFSKIIMKIFSFEKMFRYYEKLSSKYNDKGYKRLSYIAFSKGKEKHIWQKEWFDEVVSVDFEYMKINIPKGYDKRLKKEYGNYMKLSKVPTTHGDIIFEPDMPYKEYLNSLNKKKKEC